MRPFLMFLVLYVIFVKFLRIGSTIQNFPVYLLLGIVLWNFFTEITVRGVTAIVERASLISKISIPRYLLVLSTSYAALINLGLNLIVVMIFVYFNGATIDVSLLWLVPVLLLELYILGLSLAFILSAMFVKIRDISYIWEVVIQAGFYATPLLYPLQGLGVNVQEWLLLNPVAQIIQDLRAILVTDQSIRTWDVIHNLTRYVPLAVVIMLALVSYYYFRRAQRTFAEDI